MERVLGIGGYFMRAADPVVLGAWYRDCLSLDADENGLWRQGAGLTVFATFESGTGYFGSRAQVPDHPEAGRLFTFCRAHCPQRRALDPRAWCGGFPANPATIRSFTRGRRDGQSPVSASNAGAAGVFSDYPGATAFPAEARPW